MYDVFRYLVDVRWFKQWKKYVGFDEWDQQQMGSETAHPGPVDTSCLFKGMYILCTGKTSVGENFCILSGK